MPDLERLAILGIHQPRFKSLVRMPCRKTMYVLRGKLSRCRWWRAGISGRGLGPFERTYIRFGRNRPGGGLQPVAQKIVGKLRRERRSENAACLGAALGQFWTVLVIGLAATARMGNAKRVSKIIDDRSCDR